MLQAKITALNTARPAFLLLTPCCLSVAVVFAIYEGIEIDPVNLALIFIGALAASSLDAAKRNRGYVKLRLSSIPLRYIEASPTRDVVCNPSASS